MEMGAVTSLSSCTTNLVHLAPMCQVSIDSSVEFAYNPFVQHQITEPDHGGTASPKEFPMKKVCTAFAVSLVLFLLAAGSLLAACPTTSPTYYLQVTYSGTNCSSSIYGGACALGQPVAFTAAWVGFGDPLQACDAITWDYGDGTTETKSAGVVA